MSTLAGLPFQTLEAFLATESTITSIWGNDLYEYFVQEFVPFRVKQKINVCVIVKKKVKVNIQMYFQELVI